METNVCDRIQMILEEKRYSVRQLSQMIGMNATTIGRQLKGDQGVSLTLLQGVLGSFGDISAEWLMRGVGDMHIAGGIQMTDVASDEVMALKAKYEELEKRYCQLLNAISVNVQAASDATQE